MEAIVVKGVREQVSDVEWQQRVHLAACYRKVAQLGWDDLIFTHISARVPGPQPHFLLNPYGLMFDEVTASSLVKIDLDGRKVMESPFGINPAGFTIHSAVHEVREDAGCVVHLHTVAGTAVAAQKGGLLPISQFSGLALTSLSYHAYEGLALNLDERKRLQADLGNNSHMILHNHGLLTCGLTVADAFLKMYLFNRACEVQIKAQAGGDLIHIEPAVLEGFRMQAKMGFTNIGAELTWPGILRSLDRLDPSYRN